MNTTTDAIEATVNEVADAGINALPEDLQAPATELLDQAGGGLNYVWDGVATAQENLADTLEPKLGEYANAASWVAMGVGGFLAANLTFGLGKGLTSMFSNAVLGDGALSGMASSVGGLALTVGAGMLALNYMNGTGPFAPKEDATLSQNNFQNVITG